MEFSKTLKEVADEFDRICQKNKICNTCPFYKKGEDCAPSKLDELARFAKRLEERSKALMEGVQAMQKELGIK